MSEVSSILMGGLGNYMFQVAAAYAYSKRYGKDVGFNCSESSGPHKHVTEYGKNIFKDIKLFYVRSSDAKQVNENGFHYEEIPAFDGNVLLYGYFQSERYFKDFEDDVKKLFMSYDIEMDEELKNILDNENTCSIHVRRGDFLKYPNNHPVQNMNYFLRAIRRMPKDSLFLIFSDDIKWCKENFPDIPEKFRFIEKKKDYEDLYIMSHCKNNIICNSTFSWWGAWLNKNLDKTIIAPSMWFGSAYSHYNTKDIIPNKWIQI